MNDALISIITPAYNASETIARAVRSVLLQTYHNWEMLIISDDGQDYQAMLATNHIVDPRLRFSTTGTIKSGPSRGRNIGIEMARGEFITTLDSDDEYQPKYLEKMFFAASKHDVAMLIIDGKLLPDGSKDLIYFQPPANENFMVLERYFSVQGCNVTMFRKSVFTHRYLDGVFRGEDFLFDITFFATKSEIPIIYEPLYIYHFNQHSITSWTGNDTFFIDDYKATITAIENDVCLNDVIKNTVLAIYHHKLFQNYMYLGAKMRGECKNFYEYMRLYPRYFTF